MVNNWQARPVFQYNSLSWLFSASIITFNVLICSSPLLSLSHKYQWNKPSTCPYITYIQGGRQDRKTGNWRKLQHYMRKGRRIFFFNPQTMLHWGVQCENRKKNTSAQKHIYHKHNFATGGHISSSGKQPSGPAPFITALVADPLDQAWRNKAGGIWSGEGNNVCNRGGSKRVPLQRSSQGCYPAWPWPSPVPVRGSQKKIRLNCCVFGANSCILSQLFSLSILSILVSEQSRELHRDRIHIPVNSLSLADHSSHSFNQNGQPCETLTAVPVFWIFR